MCPSSPRTFLWETKKITVHIPFSSFLNTVSDTKHHHVMISVFGDNCFDCQLDTNSITKMANSTLTLDVVYEVTNNGG